MLDLFGCGVVLLLSFLAATSKAKNEVKGRLLLDVVVRKSTAIFELLPGKNQPLLIRRDTYKQSYEEENLRIWKI